MNVGEAVLLVGAAANCQELIGRRGVTVRHCDRLFGRSPYINVRVEGPQHLDKNTFLFKRKELRLLSALEQLARAGE